MRVKLQTNVDKDMKEKVKARMSKLPVSSIRSSRKCHTVPGYRGFVRGYDAGDHFRVYLMPKYPIIGQLNKSGTTGVAPLSTLSGPLLRDSISEMALNLALYHRYILSCSAHRLRWHSVGQDWTGVTKPRPTETLPCAVLAFHTISFRLVSALIDA